MTKFCAIFSSLLSYNLLLFERADVIITLNSKIAGVAEYCAGVPIHADYPSLLLIIVTVAFDARTNRQTVNIQH